MYNLKSNKVRPTSGLCITFGILSFDAGRSLLHLHPGTLYKILVFILYKVHNCNRNYNSLECSLYQFVDGWELNGQLFPNDQDHQKPSLKRFSEMCGTKKPKQVFKSSQNAALIQYRVPRRGNGFSFYVSFVKNPNRECFTILHIKS